VIIMTETLKQLQALARGTPIKVIMANDYTDNVKIVSPEGAVIYKQLNNTVGLTATSVVTAMVKVWHKRKKVIPVTRLERIEGV
jgi:hypothetical protein